MCLRACFDLSPFNDVFGSTEAHIVFNDCFCNLMQFDKRVNVRQAFVWLWEEASRDKISLSLLTLCFAISIYLGMKYIHRPRNKWSLQLQSLRLARLLNPLKSNKDLGQKLVLRVVSKSTKQYRSGLKAEVNDNIWRSTSSDNWPSTFLSYVNKTNLVSYKGLSYIPSML